MKANYARAGACALIILTILIIFMFIVENEFPIFKYAGTPTEPPVELVEADISKIGQEVSKFLWNYRATDLIAQAFVLFAAATSCVALLRIDEENRS